MRRSAAPPRPFPMHRLSHTLATRRAALGGTALLANNGYALERFDAMRRLIRGHGDINRIVPISQNQMQPVFDDMTATLDRAGRTHRQEALNSLASARNTQRVVLITTAITIIL